ncbi:hypothetical protein J41TS12_24020 [Paenibacillus antibioticophila]|uniref:Uncharacterized protein n=1 Tax=Paenibacillus antibioticophila TaxID=1274374 RepID=A0A920CEX7_9BACL|nr:hypothetical protein J41TS12_24020 [Paenibacillus antibioticophila]
MLAVIMKRGIDIAAALRGDISFCRQINMHEAGIDIMYDSVELLPVLSHRSEIDLLVTVISFSSVKSDAATKKLDKLTR